MEAGKPGNTPKGNASSGSPSSGLVDGRGSRAINQFDMKGDPMQSASSRRPAQPGGKDAHQSQLKPKVGACDFGIIRPASFREPPSRINRGGAILRAMRDRPHPHLAVLRVCACGSKTRSDRIRPPHHS